MFHAPSATGPAQTAGVLRDGGLVLPLLSFGAGAADGFAYLVLGGIFTANMTGNAVLAVLYNRAGYGPVLLGAVTAIVGFAVALAIGFRITRRLGARAALVALVASAICHVLVVTLWWTLPHRSGATLWLVAASASAMALQTVAAKRDGIANGATTTYATGTMTDLVRDIVDGQTVWWTPRWAALFALPAGAASAVAISIRWPGLTPLLPLLVTTLCIGILSADMRRRQREQLETIV